LSGPPVVAIQGEPGCNSALAAHQWFGEPCLLPCDYFTQLFAALAEKRADYAMAPVENSLGGLVAEVWDLLARQSPLIIGELFLRVRHCLIAHPGVPLQQVRFIYSHEQALAQCQRFLHQLVWIDPDHVIPVYDTAGAVKMVKARGRREEAAIAAPDAATLYGMQILAEDIQTDPRNYTRFLVLASRPQEMARSREANWKTSVVLILGDCARGLPEALQSLARRGLAVAKVETRKRIGSPWEYWVVVEFQGKAGDPAIAEVLKELATLAVEVHLLGSYPAAALP
jgi:prephenate dehydratase